MTTPALQGVKVLDLSRVLAGPICTMMLGDLGANVLKVERPGTGDETRGWGPPFDPDGQSAYFLSVNRNKLSIALDFSRQADLALILALLAEADVVIDNFLPGVLARYGIDKAAQLARHVELIWCTISGFGAASSRPGYDFVVQAESGWMSVTGEVRGAPMKTGVALVDVMTGKDAAIAILAALVGQRMGVAVQRELDISLAGTAAAALVNVAQNTLVSGEEARRWGNAHANLVPYQLFDAADRPMVIAVGSDAQWRALARVLELGSVGDDPELATNAGRLARREEIVTAIAENLQAHPATFWMTRLTEAGVPCGLVRTVREALVNVEVSAKTGVAPATGGQLRYAPPVIDAHGELVRKFRWSAFDHVPILSHRGL